MVKNLILGPILTRLVQIWAHQFFSFVLLLIGLRKWQKKIRARFWPICNFIEVALQHGCSLVNLSDYHLMKLTEHLWMIASAISIFELLYFYRTYSHCFFMKTLVYLSKGTYLTGSFNLTSRMQSKASD